MHVWNLTSGLVLYLVIDQVYPTGTVTQPLHFTSSSVTYALRLHFEAAGSARRPANSTTPVAASRMKKAKGRSAMNGLGVSRRGGGAQEHVEGGGGGRLGSAASRCGSWLECHCCFTIRTR